LKLTRFESTKIFDCVKGRWGSYFIAEDTEIFFDGKAFLRSQRFLTASKGGGELFYRRGHGENFEVNSF
jgi:hypothetical protein